MNKTAIKNYAVWARNALIERVTRKAYEYGAEIVNGRLLTDDEKNREKS